MRLFVDGDGCPVVDLTVNISKTYNLNCIILCDTSHYIEKEGVTTITVSKGADAVDFALVNMISSGDIVVTQDYALAAMCLARAAIPINQDGMVYTDDNIGGLLEQRHMAQKVRASGGRLKGPAKRTQKQNETFERELMKLIDKDTK